ncbi:hypothetical protein [Streptomyces sp. NPDC017448]|uniref:hypothetical protein n=1 Tax=Streptomyces sp. NPDC017448 TaxID=3364996 RepID=UPI0037A3FC06
MVRRDPTDRSGWVNWPTDNSGDFRDGGEGGMSAYASWAPPDGNNLAAVCSVGLSVKMLINETFVSATGPDAESYTHTGWWDGKKDWEDTGYFTDAVLLLGSTGGSWWNEEAGRYFQVSEDHLTDLGRAVLAALTDLYGFPPNIFTFLDT